MTALVGAFALSARVEHLQQRVLDDDARGQERARAGLEYALLRLSADPQRAPWRADGRTYRWQFDDASIEIKVLDENGKAAVMAMGCYGIGISRVVAAAIEQNHDDAGIIWPDAMAPWQVVVCVINPKGDAAVADAAANLLQELREAGLDAALDDRGLRPGAMFADMELIGIPHRVVVSERGLAAGTYEYRSRRASDAENLDKASLLQRLQG